MLYLRDFKGTERYKKSNYFVFSDFDKNLLGKDGKMLSEITPVLLWEDLKDGGAHVQLAIYNEIPKGYKLFTEAPRAPFGYKWIYNGKPLKEGRAIGLLKLKVEDKKYRNLEKCSDFKYLKEHLTENNLSIIENILIAYTTNQIDLAIPRDENNEIVWDGDWDIIILDPSYERIGEEILVLKWYESFEDTGYLVECFGGLNYV